MERSDEGRVPENVNHIIAADISCLHNARIPGQLRRNQVAVAATWLVDSFTAGHCLPVASYVLQATVAPVSQPSEGPSPEQRAAGGSGSMGCSSSATAAPQAGDQQGPDLACQDGGSGNLQAEPLREQSIQEGDCDGGSGREGQEEDVPMALGAARASGAHGGGGGEEEEVALASGPAAVPVSEAESDELDLNEHLTGPLAELRDIYDLALGDTWRAFTYKKAVRTLERVPFAIIDPDAVREVQGLGRSVQDKVLEILHTGRLQKLESLKSDPKVSTVQLFASVWGIGVATARSLYEAGHRTLEDLEAHAASLSSLARIGLQYHRDIAQRIAREEVAEVEATVRAAAQEVCPGAWVQVTGSYRRGKAHCGDVDMVLTHPDGSSHVGLLERILNLLYSQTFLKAGQKPGFRSTKAQEDKIDTYLGICHLPNRTCARRIDIKVYPHVLWPFALVHFTGNDILNRKVRYYANQLGFKLSDHGLFRRTPQGLLRGISCNTEEEIFDALGLPYYEPTDRNWSGPEIDQLIQSLPRGSFRPQSKKQRWS